MPSISARHPTRKHTLDTEAHYWNCMREIPDIVASMRSEIAGSISEIASHRILEAMNFFEEHGRLGEFDGKFDKQVLEHIDELFNEISCVLTRTYLHACRPNASAVGTELKRLRQHLRRGSAPNLSSDMIHFLAPHYQRKTEPPGTYWADIFGSHIDRIGYRIRRPTALQLLKAIRNAEAKPLVRKKGRPYDNGSRQLAQELKSIFERYGRRATRVSEFDCLSGKNYERSEFLSFLEFVLAPLNKYQRQLGARISPVTIGKYATSHTLT